MKHRRPIRICQLAAATVGLLILAGCGSSSPSTSPTTTGAGSSTSTTSASTSTTSASASTTPVPSKADSASTVTQAQVDSEVQAAQSLQTVPSDLTPSLADTTDGAGPGPKYGPVKCTSSASNAAGLPASDFGGCTYGDVTGKNLMVVYGDSHAQMWAEALQLIANSAGWRLVVFAHPGCPVVYLPLISAQSGQVDSTCTTFHQIAPLAIKNLHPNLVVVTSESSGTIAGGGFATPAKWQAGLMSTFQSIAEPGTTLEMIGDIPQWPLDDANCLAAHMSNVQFCASVPASAESKTLGAEQNAAVAAGAKYIPTTQFVCAAMCEPIVGKNLAYFNVYHFSATYIRYLSGPLEQAMDLPAIASAG